MKEESQTFLSIKEYAEHVKNFLLKTEGNPAHLIAVFEIEKFNVMFSLLEHQGKINLKQFIDKSVG